MSEEKPGCFVDFVHVILYCIIIKIIYRRRNNIINIASIITN